MPGFQGSSYPSGQRFGTQQGSYRGQQGVSTQGHQRMGSFGQSLAGSIPRDIQHAIGGLHGLEMIAQWTKVQAENRGDVQVESRGDVQVARHCNDLVDLAHVQKNLIPEAEATYEQGVAASNSRS